MKKLYSSQSHMIVAFLQQLLASHGIHCIVKNELLAGAAGELPPIECWPELWITDDELYARARQLIEKGLDPGGPDDECWRCCGCQELLEGQFAQCWNCGRLREGGP
jgi:hypothetical protein